MSNLALKDLYLEELKNLYDAENRLNGLSKDENGRACEIR